MGLCDVGGRVFGAGCRIPGVGGGARDLGADPDEDVAFAAGNLLHVDELFDKLLQRLVVEIELALQASERDTAALGEERSGQDDLFQEAQRLLSRTDDTLQVLDVGLGAGTRTHDAGERANPTQYPTMPTGSSGNMSFVVSEVCSQRPGIPLPSTLAGERAASRSPSR